MTPQNSLLMTLVPPPALACMDFFILQVGFLSSPFYIPDGELQELLYSD